MPPVVDSAATHTLQAMVTGTDSAIIPAAIQNAVGRRAAVARSGRS